MVIIRFLLRQGSPIVFAALIVLFALSFLPVPETATGMFALSVACLVYLSMQMGLTVFSRVGMDGPLVDMFLSLIPMITLIVIAVLGFAGQIQLSMFQQLGLGLAAMVVAMDIVFNTLVLFKMNRLANDFVPMR